METGHIVELFQEKEYGSIKTNGGEAVHFHKRCLWGIAFNQLHEGQAVKFFTQSTIKGLLGFDVQPV
ncbi:MAG TPA: cold shock domain-containing protein [Candidatus Omnitrophota bacterium]|nr:cold shock domain-containing protein [Candidatus Omnitrophota bacterium]